ncbi:hypothetical protein PHISCL_02066 [Aspergillus sclerotialis]|uniref:Uncharacterized protein n=1 Tax=Aspergillus sclerotialis TaxID=2070753 RepID=A0A3A2ZR13_9EURO|nr:hypothetical protein PHISCL_02066 [Aspergillus sclerotialis]
MKKGKPVIQWTLHDGGLDCLDSLTPALASTMLVNLTGRGLDARTIGCARQLHIAHLQVAWARLEGNE